MKTISASALVLIASTLVFACVYSQAVQASSRKDEAEWHPGTWNPAKGFTQVAIWPGAIPDAVKVDGPEELTKDGTFVGKVKTPTMTFYPARGKNTGTTVVIFPGGGYWVLAMEIEGTDVCDWLTAKGVNCVLLKYRVPGSNLFPRSGCYPKSPMALEDAQRTLRLVRAHATEWQIDPHKIGVLGFSAGGHLVAATSTLFDKKIYKPVDDTDKLSCRPDFVIALYPGHMTENTSKEFQLNPYVPITKRTPPTFIVQAENDDVDDVQNSLVYFAGLKKAGVPAELHIYPEGKHAFGLRRTKFPITGWTDLAESWMRSIGMIP